MAIKNNDYMVTMKLLSNNKFLVHNFDSRKQSPLHWASKRNFIDIMKLLIKFGARIDSIDNSGRSSLHIAASHNHLEAVIILLKELANPLLSDALGYTPNQLTSEEGIKYYLKRVKALHIIYSSLNWKEAINKIKNGIEYIFKHETYRFNKNKIS